MQIEYVDNNYNNMGGKIFNKLDISTIESDNYV